jgi:hypothetical protein
MLRTLILSLGLISLIGCSPIKTEVEFVNPNPGQTVPLNALIIEVGFDHRMNLETFDSSTFKVEGSTSGAIEGAFTGENENRRVTFTSVNLPAGGETITVELTSGLSSSSGKSVDPYQWQFAIEAGTAPPPSSFIVSSMTPGIEAYNGSTDSTINPVLSGPYDPFSIGSANIRLEGSRSGQRVTSLQNVFTGINTVTIAPDRPFLAGERVTVSLIDGVFGLDTSELPQTLLATHIANLGFDWPGNAISSGTGLSGGKIVFFDSDADGLDEWVEVAADGTLTLQDSTPSGPAGSTTWNLPEAVIDATVGDFDGDGRVDLLCLGASGTSAYLLRGSFSIAIVLEDPELIPLTVQSTHLQAAHGDRDGIIDLVLSGPDGLAVAWGDSAQPLSVILPVDATPVVSRAVATDLNGDDLIDLASVLADGSIAFHGGNGDRTFTSEGTILGYNLTQEIRAVNLDGDALRDLLLIPSGNGTPSALLSDGDFVFSLRVLFDDVVTPGAALIDWDGDGRLDCVSPISGSSGLNFSKGLADGNFQSPQLLGYASQVQSVSMGDTDGDGALELALLTPAGTFEILRSEPVVLGPANRVRIADISANPGDTVNYDVIIDCIDSLQGWTLALDYNASVMGLTNITIDGTDVAGLVEFELPNIDNSNGTVIYANILDLAPPFDNQVLAPGSGYIVATGEAFISAGAPAGNYDFTPANGIVANTSPETDNSFVVNGNSVFPELVGGTVTINGSSPAQAPEDENDTESDSTDTSDSPAGDQVHFIRGDVNGDGVIDLTDGTQLQVWIGNATPLACPDAADVNDDGVVDEADPVYIFDFLYQGSNPPPAPFPAAGPDPTADGLDCQSSGVGH